MRSEVCALLSAADWLPPTDPDGSSTLLGMPCSGRAAAQQLQIVLVAASYLQRLAAQHRVPDLRVGQTCECSSRLPALWHSSRG